MCECKNNTITVTGNFGGFNADEEPYESGVYENISEDDEYLVAQLEFYITATICKDCKKASFWSPDGKLVGIQDLD